VVEPTVQQTVEILKGLKSRFEEHHSVKYAVAALQAAAELSAKYINDRHLPDKAIDVIDEAGAAQRILAPSKRKKTITKTEVEEIVAKIARIPPANVSNDDRGKLQTLERDLKNVVFGRTRRSTCWPRPSRWRARAWARATSPLAPSCSAAPRAWARPRLPSNWPTSWALT
jgi:ATP-dependent Clp protease ATP-binding subunit ClpA